MKTILLVGEVNDVLKNLNRIMGEFFQVQVSSDQKDHVENMLDLAQPDLVLISTIGESEELTDTMEMLKQYRSKLPILVISTNMREYKRYCPPRYYDVLVRPLHKEVLLEKCYRLLGIADRPKLQEAPAEPKKVMVIDDSALMLRSMKTKLEQKYQVRIVPSGEKGLELMKTWIPDVLLLDYEMPGMDGKEVFEAMLEQEELKDVPVVFLTSISDRQKIYDVLKSKPAGYILKPPDFEKLMEMLEDILVNDVSDI